MSWVLFQWGSRGLYYDTGLGVYVAHEFIDHGIQVTVFGHGEDAEELLHTFHVSATAVLPDSTDCLAVANAVHGWVIDASDGLNKLCHTGVEFDRVVAQSIAEFEGPFAELVIGSSGTRAGDHMPSLLCMNVKKSSDHGGRSRRGYFATWPMVVADKDSTDPSRFDSTYEADCIANYTALMTSVGLSGYPLVIASRSRQTLYPVTAISVVTPAIRSRHSRAEGIGR